MTGCLGPEMEKVLSRLTQPRWDVVHGQDHWASALVAHPLIKGIHSIGAQAKPYIFWVIDEFFVLLIEPLPLTTISQVCTLIIIHFPLIIPPCHECGFFRV